MAEKGSVRVAPEALDEDFPLVPREPAHPLTGSVRVTLTMPYFKTHKDAQEWVRRNIPGAKPVVRNGSTSRNVYEFDNGCRIVIQTARATVKWE